MKRFLLTGICATFLTACATMPTQAIWSDTHVPFNADEAQWASAKGDNAIRGNAVLRTVGGEVKTCAGFPASLVPATSYGEGRLLIIYGSKEKGYNPTRGGRQIVPAIPEYTAISRETICDSNGEFEFSNLADGVYYIITTVSWGVPTRYFTQQEGGTLMQRVEVANGETKKVVLTLQ